MYGEEANTYYHPGIRSIKLKFKLGICSVIQFIIALLSVTNVLRMSKYSSNIANIKLRIEPQCGAKPIINASNVRLEDTRGSARRCSAKRHINHHSTRKPAGSLGTWPRFEITQIYVAGPTEAR